MAKRTTGKVPDAWEDDDWEVQADKAAAVEEEEPEPRQQPQLSRAERLAQHAESNRKLWESAEAPPETFHYLASRSDPPLATSFKPTVKVLSRKPLQDAGDLDEEDSNKPPQLTPEEIQAKQQREREEKQRRYDEARAKIFGSNQSSGTSTPGAVTPPRSADGRGPEVEVEGGEVVEDIDITTAEETGIENGTTVNDQAASPAAAAENSTTRTTHQSPASNSSDEGGASHTRATRSRW
ncbi:hypothetical protein ABKA04_010241 [Annulohypoxylon sp. FPYF3050]